MYNTNGLNTGGMFLPNKSKKEAINPYSLKSKHLLANQAYIALRKKYDEKRDDCGRIRKHYNS